MQVLPGRPSLDRIALKWHDLAQRRLDHYTELYRSGRWQRYYTQERFAMRMLDVINAARKWRVLAGLPESAPVEPPSMRDETMRSDETAHNDSAARNDNAMRPAA